MSEFPPPLPTSLDPAAGAESKDGWWKRRSRITKGLLITGVVVLGIGAVGSALAQAEDESVADPAPEVEAALEVESVADPAPEVEAALEDESVADPAPDVEGAVEDEFKTWLIDHLPTVLGSIEDIETIDQLLDAGLDVEAGKLSVDVAATFFGLEMTAPETGTELSDVTNEMFRTCSDGFGMAAFVIDRPNVNDFNVAKDEISECIRLVERTNTLIAQ